jgi:signal transduction histidine kinase
MHSFLGVPVAVKGFPVGNLYLTDKGGSPEFSEQDQRLVETFALHAGIAIENARLHEQVQRLAVVEERERIGKDLHDGIIQSIYGVGLALEDVPELMDEDREEATARIDRAIDALNVTIRDIRNFIFGLRPELLESADLVAGLSTLVDEFRVNTMIDVELRVDAEAVDLPPDARVQVLHIAREALSNAARHSGATHVDVSIDSEGDALALTVADNGRGFDPGTVGGAGHFGLENVATRAAAVGGKLALESAPGSGTRIIVRIPVVAPAAKESRSG